MRRIRRYALATAALVGLAVSILPFVYPATDEPDHADAVVILSGDHGERLERAMDLIERGVTSTLVLDGTPDSARGVELCMGGQSFEVICLRPDPDDTREEARAAGRLTAAKGWDRVVVSTSTYHVFRSALVFRRCVDGEVMMVAGDPPFGRNRIARAVVREWLAVAYALILARRC